MRALAASDPQADRKWHLQLFGLGNRKSNGHHHIIFLKSFCIRRIKIKIPEILLCRLYLDDDQGCLRRCSGKIFSGYHISGSNTRQCRAMAVGISGWHDGKRLLGSQCPVNILFPE